MPFFDSGRRPLPSLRRYLAVLIVLALFPLAALVCWQILGDVRREQEQIEASLARSAATLAQALNPVAGPVGATPPNLEVLLRHGAPKGGQAMLQDSQGTVVAWTLAVAPSTSALAPVTVEALRSREAGVQRLPGPEGRTMYAAWHRIPVSGGTVTVSLPARPIDSAHRNAILTAFGGTGLSLLLGIVLASLAARRVTEPMHRLATAGPATLAGPMPVQELALLRDALALAGRRDAEARRALEQDIARRKQVEAELLGAHEQLRALTQQAVEARQVAEAANRAKDEFLSMLGHELRNPMGAITAALDVLEAAPADSPIAREAHDIITRQTRNLAHMVDDLLDAGRVIAGKIVLARAPVNLQGIVERVRATLELTGQLASHRLRVDARPAWVHGDAVRLEQVVTNLLSNALKYTPAGGTIDVRVSAGAGTATLEVQDDGPGIPAELLPRVFELFVQGERPLDRQAGGLGIGLTLVQRLVELHAGQVQASSSDQGSRFTVRLPAIAAPAERPLDELPPSQRRSVLVVDDNADVLAALRAKLELDGHAVSTAADGIDGLQRLLRQQPEVSIVDIGLPGLTGFELARHARAAGYAGRLIALSGYGHDRDVRDALTAGFDAYLVKPVGRTQLRATLAG